MRNYLAFGAGVNSVALYLLLKRLGREFEAIFVDHGTDWPETYSYVRKFSAMLPVTRIRPEYHRPDMGKTYNCLYDYCWDRRTIPLSHHRWCSQEFKVSPLLRYVERPCRLYIGIDASESHRKSECSDPKVHFIYPLINYKIDRQHCEKLILKAGLTVPINSRCFICPFQRISEWKQLYIQHPDLFAKARALEQRAREHARATGNKVWALRLDGQTLWDLEKRFRREIKELLVANKGKFDE